MIVQRLFARADYEGLSAIERFTLRRERKRLAKHIKKQKGDISKLPFGTKVKEGLEAALKKGTSAELGAVKAGLREGAIEKAAKTVKAAKKGALVVGVPAAIITGASLLSRGKKSKEAPESYEKD